MQPAVIAPQDSVRLTDTLPPRWPGRPVVLDGSVTYLRETPATIDHAEPALFVHGLGGSSANWTDLAGLLANRLAGQAIDLPGFGRSDPARSYSIPAVAARVIRWIEYSDRGPVHLFGNSLGGAIAVRVAGTRPDLIRTLTLISPAMPFLDPRRSAHGRMVPLLWIPRADLIAQRRMRAIEPAELGRQVLELCFADPSRIPEQRMAEAVEETRLRYDVPWYLDAYVRTLRALVGTGRSGRDPPGRRSRTGYPASGRPGAAAPPIGQPVRLAQPDGAQRAPVRAGDLGVRRPAGAGAGRRRADRAVPGGGRDRDTGIRGGVRGEGTGGARRPAQLDGERLAAPAGGTR